MSNEKVCKPGFNSCVTEEEAKSVPTQATVASDDKVCKPGFNSCEDPAVTKKAEDASNTCKPGFNSCTLPEGEKAAAVKGAVAVTEQNFQAEVMRSDKPVLVDFWAEWCGHCKNLSPIIQEIAAENADRFKVCMVNVEESPTIAQAFDVVGIPLLAVVKDGKIVTSSAGYKSKEEVLALMGNLPDAAPAAAEEKVCKPGFNSCDAPAAPMAPAVDPNAEKVCKPGFNSCDAPAAPAAAPKKEEGPKVCKPGFNSCD